MTQQEVLDLINQFITTNGNNEITANVLNPILEEMVNQPNLLIGVLSQLNTADQTNLVNAINEVYNMFGSVSDAGIRIYEGISDPNTTPPAEYKIGDFYIQKDSSNNPVKLFQYNGFGWFAPLGIFDIIDDSITANDSTWSSEKIVDEIETAISGAGTVTEVTGVSGEITVANGTTTPVIGIDPSYTTARNAYSDSKISQTITDGVTDKAPSENAVFDALPFVRHLNINNSVTGTTAEVYVASFLIPSNTLKDGQKGIFKIAISKTAGNANFNPAIYISPTGGAISGLKLMTGRLSTTTRGSVNSRNFVVRNGFIRIFNPSTALVSDETETSILFIDTPAIDFTINQYINITSSCTVAAETCSIEYVSLTIFK